MRSSTTYSILYPALSPTRLTKGERAKLAYCSYVYPFPALLDASRHLNLELVWETQDRCIRAQELGYSAVVATSIDALSLPLSPSIRTLLIEATPLDVCVKTEQGVLKCSSFLTFLSPAKRLTYPNASFLAYANIQCKWMYMAVEARSVKLTFDGSIKRELKVTSITAFSTFLRILSLALQV